MLTTPYKIADTIDEFNDLTSSIIEIEVADKKICITVHNKKMFAFAATCPHAGAQLCNGRVDALGNIVCPLHHYKFNLKNGYNTSGEGYFLKTYKTIVDETGVFVLL